MEMRKRSYESDVLVLGSSAAGCGAAIAARRAGAEVLLADKGKLESSGCLGGGNDHFMAVLDEVEHDGLEDLYAYYATPVSGLTRDHVRNFYDAMKPCIKILEDAGVELMHNPDGSYMRSVGFGQPGPWWIHINHGYNVKPLLAKYIRNLGVKPLDHFMVTHLLKDGNRIAGCMGFDVLKGDVITVRCKTVVLCMGLTAQRVSNNSSHKPFNQWFSPFVTGSQIMLPLKAGESVLNLDISDMATMLPKGYGCPGMNGINSSGAHEINALGERFMPKYHPQMENCPRQFQIGGTYQEQIEGNGPPFVMEMRHIDPELLRHLQYVLMPGDKATFLDYCEQRGVDFARAPMEVEIGEIEFSGMLATDDAFRSTVPGLYNGCVFYTFSGSMCSGYLAGESASREMGRAAGLSGLEEEIAAECERIFRPLEEQEDGISQKMFESSIRQVMSYYMGFVRNEKGIDVALERLGFLAGYEDRIQAGNMHELMMAHEAVHLLKSCRLSTLCTRERRESGRSIYRRSDYPEKSPEYEKVLAVSKSADGPSLFWMK